MKIVVKINRMDPLKVQRALLNILVKQNKGRRIFKVEYSSETTSYQLVGFCFKKEKDGKRFKKIFFGCYPSCKPSKKEEEGFWRDYNLMKSLERRHRDKKCNRKN